MSTHFIASNNTHGEVVFLDNQPQRHHAIPIAGGSIRVISSTYSTPPAVSTEDDVEKYLHDRTHGFGDGRICPETGSAGIIVTMEGDAKSPMHRTMTVDTCVILEGTVELHSDRGGVRTLSTGDSVVMRAVMHQWVNVTPEKGVAKMVAFVQTIQEPLIVGSTTMKAEWVD